MWPKRLLLTVVSVVSCPVFASEEPVGSRPYEMVWVNRTEDTHPALIDFEQLDGWGLDRREAEASFSRTRRQQLWGQYVGTLVYRSTGKNPVVTIKPPKPIALPQPVDCLNLWVYGNNWAWAPDPKTPPVEIAVLLRSKAGSQVRVALGRVHWQEWWVMHRRLTPDELALLKDGGTVEGLEVAGGRNTEDRVLHFDNLSVYQEQLPPLKFDRRPARPFDPVPDGTPGLNVGPELLPFPNRAETILPENLTQEFKTDLEQSGGQYVFHYRGKDGHLSYRYQPLSGTLGDILAEWEGAGGQFRPMDGGGVQFAADQDQGAGPPEKYELVKCVVEGGAVAATWRARLGTRTTDVQYVLRLKQKSLVIDVSCPASAHPGTESASGVAKAGATPGASSQPFPKWKGGMVGEFRFGRASGLAEPRLVTIPYLVCDQSRPAVVVAGPPQRPLFLMALADHYLSNASSMWASNSVAADGVVYNGGTRYLSKTDGQRNRCFERLYVTVSPRFEEVLPTVANPKSPWMHVAGERLWIAHGASSREQDYALWKKVARHGMTKVVITDHETGWRDGGESFTLRTRAAPGKGGDEGQADYARKVRAVGFRYGIYNNYTDFAPVNEHWSEDYVTRLPDGQWQPAWARCYNLKPSRAVELEARLAPIIQQKFHLDTAYCDVHTAVTPWSYCDFDARVPRAGTFGATFYAYGEIMLHQKKTWNGPVYSEGNNHWYYCGLTDGNYGQDQAARLDIRPWLVDFDLRKLHPLCCNFGMGNLGMFYGDGRGWGATPDEQEARLDRFLAATLAFGHTGFLVLDGGMPTAVRSYFSLQQLHAAYAQATAAEIRYADAEGRLLDTSAAVATGAFKRSQIQTRYGNGLTVTVNGHPNETWATPDARLPPNGWFVKDRDGKLRAFSATWDGHRADYVGAPAYVYADGRGRFTRFAEIACDGQVIVHRRSEAEVEVVPVGKCTDFGVRLEGRAATATALDEEGRPVGSAETRLARGLVYVVPVPNAFSYVLKSAAAPRVSLSSERDKVVPGEAVKVSEATSSPAIGATTAPRLHAFRVPADAKPGARLWQEFNGAWIDFTVMPLFDASLRVGKPSSLRLDLVSHLPLASDIQVVLGDQARSMRVSPGTPMQFDFPVVLKSEEVRTLPLRVTAGESVYQRAWRLAVRSAPAALASLGDEFQAGQRLRRGQEKGLGDGSGSQAHWQTCTCGGVERRGLFMHPPYMGGVGYAHATFGPLELPAGSPAAFRCQMGKADGSDPGDGILFRVAIVEPDGRETIVAEKQWIQHAWSPLEADLGRWAGKRVGIKLIADVGPVDNSSGDWACWAEPRVETVRPVLVPTVEPAEAR